MGSQIVRIFRQGVWASLTGGWFYDPHHDIFTNTVHMYSWLFFLCFPLTLYIIIATGWAALLVYCCTITATFAVIKVINYRVHLSFDKKAKEDESNKQETDQQGTTSQGDQQTPTIDPNNSIHDANTNRSGNEPEFAEAVIDRNYDENITSNSKQYGNSLDKTEGDNSGEASESSKFYTTENMSNIPTAENESFINEPYSQKTTIGTEIDERNLLHDVRRSVSDQSFRHNDPRFRLASPPLTGLVQERSTARSYHLQDERGSDHQPFRRFPRLEPRPEPFSLRRNMDDMNDGIPAFVSREREIEQTLILEDCDIQRIYAERKSHSKDNNPEGDTKKDNKDISPMSSRPRESKITENKVRKRSSSFHSSPDIEKFFRGNLELANNRLWQANSHSAEDRTRSDSYDGSHGGKHIKDEAAENSQGRRAFLRHSSFPRNKTRNLSLQTEEGASAIPVSTSCDSLIAQLSTNSTIGSTSATFEDRNKSGPNSSSSSAASMQSVASCAATNGSEHSELQAIAAANIQCDIFTSDTFPTFGLSEHRGDVFETSTDYQHDFNFSNLMNDKFVRLSGGEDDTDEFEILFPESRSRRSRLARTSNRGSGTRRRRNAPLKTRAELERDMYVAVLAKDSSRSRNDNPLVLRQPSFTDNTDDLDSIEVPITRPRETSVSIDGNRQSNYSVRRHVTGSDRVAYQPTVLVQNDVTREQLTTLLRLGLVDSATIRNTSEGPAISNDFESGTDCSSSEEPLQVHRVPKHRLPDRQPIPVAIHTFKIKILPWKTIQINSDRLSIEALLDRNFNITEIVLQVTLAALVSGLGFLILMQNYLYEFWVFWFCFVMASCHFSLLKSVQPDACSPAHGYNKITVYSRSVYFCICTSIILILDAFAKQKPDPMYLYGLRINNPTVVLFARDLMIVITMLLPFLFLLGIFPQVNTFCLYCLEQVDIHVFGGSALTSLHAAVFTIIRNIALVALNYAICYAAIPSTENAAGQNSLGFSAYCAVLVSTSFFLSRSNSDPTIIWSLAVPIFKHGQPPEDISQSESNDLEKMLPERLKVTIRERLHNDAVTMLLIMLIVFAVHATTIFNFNAMVMIIIQVCIGVVGVILHYILPQMRKHQPWLCFKYPILKSREYHIFEVTEAAKIMWFEKFYITAQLVECNVLYIFLFLAAITHNAAIVMRNFGPYVAPLILTITGIKAFRSSFCRPAHQYLTLIFTVLCFNYDLRKYSETFMIDFFFMGLAVSKIYELVLRMKFVLSYISPWQIAWGSAFHAFAQPFSAPHSAMLFLQTIISAVLSAPLNPFLGSAIFITSYARPLKFWERNYNTQRADHSNVQLSSYLERSPLSFDDNNLNSIFYEHLAYSLQKSLCGDILLGRWGIVMAGDCFVLASDYLNCLVHIIEIGNGFVTFQIRGLEFKGTYCQQREVEAITEEVHKDKGCCCCNLKQELPYVLSLNAAFNQRWLAWEVKNKKYICEGYSISDNSASPMLRVYDLRKILITYYVKAILYYLFKIPNLEEWLDKDVVKDMIATRSRQGFVDIERLCFYNMIDEDFDLRKGGITMNSFCNIYFDWIKCCAKKRSPSMVVRRESPAVVLSFAFATLGRRALGVASNNQIASLDSFLYGLHSLFKGDIRVMSDKDEWVFSDFDMLKKVIAPAIRISLKLHQDHFTACDEYENVENLYSAIEAYNDNIVICHEADPQWRQAVLSNAPSLLALRHVLDEGVNEYKIIMLNKTYLNFRVIKINRECVRGLWAGQQQELIFFRNSNPERGSIQNAKQALRNIVNSSCDQPIGYPIYVSPLLTSYSETSEQLTSITGRSISFPLLSRRLSRLWSRISGYCSSDRNNSRANSCINNVTVGFQEPRTGISAERSSTGSNSAIDRRSSHRPDSTSQYTNINANTEDSKANKSTTWRSSEVIDRAQRIHDKDRNANESNTQSNISMVELSHQNPSTKLTKSNSKLLESSLSLESRTSLQGSVATDTCNVGVNNFNLNSSSKHTDLDSIFSNGNVTDICDSTDDHPHNSSSTRSIGKSLAKLDATQLSIITNAGFRYSTSEQNKASSSSSV